MKKRRPIFWEERVKIEELVAKNYSLDRIALILNRAKSSVYGEISKNTKPYNAKDAQERVDAVLHKTSVKRCNTFVDVYNKINNLQQQIDIILDVLKERNNGEH